MAEPPTQSVADTDTDALIAQWQELSEQSKRVMEAFLERQENEDAYSIVDFASISQAFPRMSAKMLEDPGKLAQAQAQLWQDSLKLWQSTTQRLIGGEAEPVAAAERGDRRFKDKAWEEELAFDHIKQTYLLAARWMQGLVNDVDGLDRRDREKIDFYTRQYLSAVSPSNALPLYFRISIRALTSAW